MIWMYLTKDVVGSYSKINYGFTGDRVAILKNESPLCLVVHECGHLFYCNYDLLSNQKIEKITKQNGEKKKKRV